MLVEHRRNQNNISFQAVNIHPGVEIFGDEFARELQIAKRALERRYKNKDFFIKASAYPFGQHDYLPHITVKTRKRFKTPDSFSLNPLQKIREKLFGGRRFAGESSDYICKQNPRSLTAGDILEKATLVAKKAQNELRKDFRTMYGSVKQRKAAKIFNTPLEIPFNKPTIISDDKLNA